MGQCLKILKKCESKYYQSLRTINSHVKLQKKNIFSQKKEVEANMTLSLLTLSFKLTKLRGN